MTNGAAFTLMNDAANGRLMDALGWRVGGPNAGRRATMVVVTTLGAIGAALAAGAALGHRLTRQNSLASAAK